MRRFRCSAAAFTAVVVVGSVTSLAATVSTVSTASMASAAMTPTHVNGIHIAQLTAVNAAQTSYPITLDWTYKSPVSYEMVYRHDADTHTVHFVGKTAKGVAHIADAIPVKAGLSDMISYQLEAYDSSGHDLGQDSYGLIRALVEDDASANIAYTGSWVRKTLSGATKGHDDTSSTPGATATYEDCYFNVALVATTSPAGGTADLLVDGVLAQQVNFKSAGTVTRRLVYKFGSTTFGCHTLELVQTSGQVNVDAFQSLIPVTA